MRFERIGSYDVTALIGEGGMGQVYQATDTKLNRRVALEILPERLRLLLKKWRSLKRDAFYVALGRSGLDVVDTQPQ